MPTIETLPYEFLARWGQDGKLKACQVQRREVLVRDDGTRQDLRVLDAEPLESGSVPFKELMREAEAAALLTAEALRKSLGERDARIALLSKDRERMDDIVKAANAKAEQDARTIAELTERLAGMEADRDGFSTANARILKDAEAAKGEVARLGREVAALRAEVAAHESVARAVREDGPS